VKPSVTRSSNCCKHLLRPLQKISGNCRANRAIESLPCLPRRSQAKAGAKVESVNRSLPCDRGEDEKGAADNPEKQTHDPELAFLRKRGDCRDGNRDLEHGHAAGEDFVFVKV
jgi:hypothetical protein